MTFLLDPLRDWETSWERQNPEPYPVPQHEDAKLRLVWVSSEVMTRIEWHQRRWVAFKEAFPEWRNTAWGIQR